MKETFIRQLAAKPLPWLGDRELGTAIALSSRVRLARNLAGQPFPGRANLDTRLNVLRTICDALRSLPVFQPCCALNIHQLGEVERRVLLERRLISPELCRQGAGSAVVVRSDEVASALINEEDHVRLQTLLPGLQLGHAWQQMCTIDKDLGNTLEFAFDRELGFLTACPSNVGTGMRASVMLHLPGLVLCDWMEAIARAAQKLGVTVRGALGEGSGSSGNLFQFSNQSTLGQNEPDIVQGLEDFVRQLIWHENSARMRLLRAWPERAYDVVGRAFGLLREARVLASGEATEYLLALRFGSELGFFTKLAIADIDALLADVQPGHWQQRARCELDSAERDIQRADLVRLRLREAQPVKDL